MILCIHNLIYISNNKLPYLNVFVCNILHHGRKQFRCIFPFGDELDEDRTCTSITFCPVLTPQFVVSNYSMMTRKKTFVHPYDPLHGLQFERLLVALQHLLKVIVPKRTNRTQSYPDLRRRRIPNLSLTRSANDYK